MDMFDNEWDRMTEQHERVKKLAIFFTIVGWIVLLGIIAFMVAVVSHFVWGWP